MPKSRYLAFGTAQRKSPWRRCAALQFGSQAAKLGVEAGFRVIAVEVPGNRIAREWMFLPALMLIAWVLRRQRLRYGPAPA